MVTTPLTTSTPIRATTVLTVDGHGIAEHEVRFAHRLRVHFFAGRLDRDLAAGTCPEATVALALRAQWLVSPTMRTNVALSLRRLISVADAPPSPMGGRMPICRSRMRAAQGELQALSNRLLTCGPVSPQGVARLTALLTDGSGPLYRQGCTDDLNARLRDVLVCLDTLDATSRADPG